MENTKTSFSAPDYNATDRHLKRDRPSGEVHHVKEFASDAKEMAADVYSEASTWMQQNYGKTLAIVGAAAAVGVIGYLIGRSSRSTSIEVVDRSGSSMTPSTH